MRADAILSIPLPSAGIRFIRLLIDFVSLLLALFLLLSGMNLGIVETLHFYLQIIYKTLSDHYGGIGVNNIALMLGCNLGEEIQCTLLHITLALLGKIYLLADSIKAHLVGSASANLLNLVGEFHKLLVELSLLGSQGFPILRFGKRLIQLFQADRYGIKLILHFLARVLEVMNVLVDVLLLKGFDHEIKLLVTLRNIIGDLELDQTLTSRETINTKMRAALDIATDPWGIKVNRVELKNIIPPAEIQNAMEKQMKAERERREAVTRAEGEKKAKILEAEGAKESAILRAEADKQAAILRAEAEKEKMIREAEGEAEAILKVQQANADGIKMLKEAGADAAVLKLKSLEAFEKVADGQATTILLPAELQGIASVAETFKAAAGK